MQRYVDKSPPVSTGNPKEDIVALVQYLEYLRNQVNFNVTQNIKQSQKKEEE
jgi:hypothetical protein